MDIGTAEPVIEGQSTRRRSSRISGGGPGGSNGGGGDDWPFNFPDPASNTDDSDKSRVVTWFLLLVVTMTFGGLIGAYIVIATNSALEWRPFNLPFQVWISTILIIASSLVYAIAKRAFDNEEHERAKKFLIGTTALGAAFISSQLMAWLALVNRGLYMRGNPYAGFFYILTAVHGAHVLGGIIALGAILLRSWYPTVDEKELAYRKNLARSVGYYWHFMGGLWIVLFVLLGFWK